MLVLGIETSCDETGVALYDTRAGLLGHTLFSQVAMHAEYGGVVPELASRDHVRRLLPLTRQLLGQTGRTLDQIDGIAFTQGPGLAGALLVGASVAASLGFALGIPVIGLHHLEGHLLSPLLSTPAPRFPFVALLVSGGHTQLMKVGGVGDYALLGETVDDAAGEAFDKTAKLLGLPYPGGPHVERLAREGDPARHRFSRPMLNRGQQPGDADYYDVSFSGLKTAVLHAVRAADGEGEHAHIARGFHDALVETLVEKTARAAEAFGRMRIVLGGGVAGNRTLAASMRERVRRRGAEVYAPSSRLATDNAAMIARAGLFHHERGERAPLDLNAFASQPLPGLVPA